MKKFEIFKESVEIKFKDYSKVKAGCTRDCKRRDHEPELIMSFDNLEEAKEFLKSFKSSIINYGSYYLVEEYYIEENTYDVDGGDVWGFSEMEIKVIEKPSYDCIGVYNCIEDAKNACEDSEIDCFVSFD